MLDFFEFLTFFTCNYGNGAESISHLNLLDKQADIVYILRGYEIMDVGGENFIFLQIKVQWTYIEHSVMSHPEKVVLDSRFMESNRLESVDE